MAFADAEPFAREAHELQRKRRGAADLSDDEREQQLTLTREPHARALEGLGRYAGAEPHRRALYTVWKKVAGDDDTDEGPWVIHDLAAVLGNQEKYAEAVPLFRQALAMGRRVFKGQDNEFLAMCALNLARALGAQGQAGEVRALVGGAAAVYRKVAARDEPDPRKPVLANGLARVAQTLAAGGHPGAEALAREALRLIPARPTTGDVVNDLDRDRWACLGEIVLTFQVLGKYAEAEPLLREKLTAARRRLTAYVGLGMEDVCLFARVGHDLYLYLHNARALRTDPAVAYAVVWDWKGAARG